MKLDRNDPVNRALTDIAEAITVVRRPHRPIPQAQLEPIPEAICTLVEQQPFESKLEPTDFNYESLP